MVWVVSNFPPHHAVTHCVCMAYLPHPPRSPGTFLQHLLHISYTAHTVMAWFLFFSVPINRLPFASPRTPHNISSCRRSAEQCDFVVFFGPPITRIPFCCKKLIAIIFYLFQLLSVWPKSQSSQANCLIELYNVMLFLLLCYFCWCCFKIKFNYVAQAASQLWSSCLRPLSAGIMGSYQHTWSMRMVFWKSLRWQCLAWSRQSLKQCQVQYSLL